MGVEKGRGTGTARSAETITFRGEINATSAMNLNRRVKKAGRGRAIICVLVTGSARSVMNIISHGGANVSDARQKRQEKRPKKQSMRRMKRCLLLLFKNKMRLFKI